MKYQTKFGKNIPEIKNYIFCKKQWKVIIATMTRHTKLGSHTWFQINRITITSLDIAIPSLALFCFVLLLFC